MRSSVSAAFIQFTAQLEGVVPWMYADVKGLVTTGIGNLIDPIYHALPLPWLRADGTLASPVEIESEWNRIKSNPLCAKYGHKYAKQFTNLHLSDDGVEELVLGKLDQFDRYLASRFHEWDSWPADAQLATLSVSWACGPAFRFPALDQALRDRDFAMAAKHCHISESGNPGIIPRNKANHALYMNASRSGAWRYSEDELVWPSILGDEPPTEPELPTVPSEPTIVIDDVGPEVFVCEADGPERIT